MRNASIPARGEGLSASPEKAIRHLSYISQLDGFRFFAVFLVILSHWLPSVFINRIPNGFIGVTFFFVLSGFLISSNLLYSKQNRSDGKITLTQALKNFYIRRSLRIFPLYYFVIFLALALVPVIFQDHFLWYAAYLPNFLLFRLGHWQGMISHFWTLGLEEQFYLIWPLLILLTPWRKLNVLFIATIVICLGFKIVLFALHFPFFNWYGLLPLNCFDSFAIGAVLSLLVFRDPGFPESILSRYHLWKIILFVVVAYVLADLAGMHFFKGLLVSLASFFFIAQGIKGYKGIPKIILDNQTIRYLGKISYGLYVFHNFIPWLLRCLMGTEQAYPMRLPVIMNWSWLHGGLRIFIAEFAILIVVASVSWYGLERPINRLKRYFVY